MRPRRVQMSYKFGNIDTAFDIKRPRRTCMPYMRPSPPASQLELPYTGTAAEKQGNYIHIPVDHPTLTFIIKHSVLLDRMKLYKLFL